MSEEPEPLALRRSIVLLGACAAAYLIVFLLFYPPTHGIEDEVGFLNQTLVFSRGAISAEGAGFERLSNFVPIGEQQVCWRNPGRAVVTAPFWVVGGYGAVFVSGALIHLLTVWVAALVLVRLGRDPLWAALVLFHPTLLLFSRTVMADGLGGLFVVTSVYAIVRGGRHAGLLGGVAIGGAVLARYHLAALVPFVALALWRRPEAEHPGRDAVGFLAGAGVWAVAIASYNATFLGGVFGPTSQGYFAAEFLGPNVRHYLIALVCLWPGMIAAPLLVERRWRGLFLAATAPLLVLLCGYYWRDARPSWIETAVVGQRLLQPVLAVWIVAYALVVSERAPDLRRAAAGVRRGALTVGVAGLLIGAVLLFQRHQRHLLALLAVRDAFVERVPAGALVLASPSLTKLFEVPGVEGLPAYRFEYYHYQGAARVDEARLARERAPFFLAHLSKGGAAPPASFGEYVTRCRATPIEAPARLALYRIDSLPRAE